MADATPPAPVGPTFEELEKQLEELLKPADLTPTANVRILFARAWLAKLMREPEKSEKIFNIIIDVAKPEDLSPLMLSIVGENARKKGDLDKAAACFERLRTIFPNSEFADGAPVGLAEIHYEKKEYDKALEMFLEATSDKYQGSSSILQATLGKAKTLLKVGKFADAEKEYDQIARTKEWRQSWPEALYGLGQVREAKKDWAGANAFYIRVFVGHQKYKDWMARSYLQSARCFLLLNKKEEAKRTLDEMLKRQDIKEQPEYKEAQQERAKIGA
jgi:tetratricopeptide (TPR) repeat protein